MFTRRSGNKYEQGDDKPEILTLSSISMTTADCSLTTTEIIYTLSSNETSKGSFLCASMHHQLLSDSHSHLTELCIYSNLLLYITSMAIPQQNGQINLQDSEEWRAHFQWLKRTLSKIAAINISLHFITKSLWACTPPRSPLNNHVHSLISLDVYGLHAASAPHVLIGLHKIDITRNILSSHGR